MLAIVNDNIAQLDITNEISAGLSSIKALSTVSVDLNGVVAGYGLISELENGIVKSAFGVNADTFYIGKPTDAVKPFVVSSVPTTIDGIDFPAGTWINSAIIANATIGSAHIKDAAITTAKIQDASITDAKIVSLSANKISVPTSDPFPVKVTANDVTVTSNKSISGAVGVLFDGNYATGGAYVTFGEGKADRSEDAYLQVDLKDVRKISQAVLWFYAEDGCTYEYKIKYSNDGTNWKYLEGSPTVWIKSAQPKPNNEGTYVNTATPTQVYMGSLFECRYLRIYGNGNTVNTGNHLYELEIASQSFNTVIDGSGILTNSITADKIQVDSLSAISAELGTIKVGSANIADLSVNAAHISDAAITTAKIGDLQVDSLKIKDDAVSIGIGAQGVATITTISNGGKLRLDIGVQAYYFSTYIATTLGVRVLRHGVVIRTFSFPATYLGAEGLVSFSYACALPPVMETIAAGTTVTYRLQITDHNGNWMEAGSGGVWVGNSGLSLAVTELKK